MVVQISGCDICRYFDGKVSLGKRERESEWECVLIREILYTKVFW